MTTCTTCPYCGVGCGVLATVDGRIKGDPEHPSNFGRLCSKGSALAETTDLEGRITTPLIGKKQASWNTALDLVADKFTASIRDYGPDSVGFYVSGQILSEDYYVANKLIKGYIGSANIDTNSRLCMASSVAGHKRAFGTDTVPGNYQDLDNADLIVLVGSNLAWCHPILYQRILTAKKARPKLKIINIDPRRTASSADADLHLSIRPDTDSVLFNGLLAEIVTRQAVNDAYVSAHVDGFDDALKTAKASNLASTGLSPDDIQTFYDLWIGTEKVVTVFSQGVNQSVVGTDKVNSIINCHLATGRIGRAGMGPFSVTGQPNAMGGREVGGLANMLACHLDIENSEHRQAVQQAWNSPVICSKPGLKAVDMFQACESGKIKALWIISTNPVVSMPDSNAIIRALETVPFCVVSDITNTDTTALADVILPATAWGEKTGTVTNSERRISMQRQFLPTPGHCRPDWQIICDVAQRMGWQDGFDYSGPAEIFREYAALSGVAASFGKDFDISGLASLSNEQYAAFKPVQWPVPASGQAGGRFFSDGGFFHPDGKARMLPILTDPVVKPAGLRLNSGRIRDQWHTMTRSGKSARLSQHLTEPFVEIHPDDAADLEVQDGGLLEVRSNLGVAIMRTVVTENTQAGMIFAPMHWSGENSSAGRINAVVPGICDPVSGQPATKGSYVLVQAFNPCWYGFAASTTPIQPDLDYSAIARTSTGWSCEMAGLQDVNDWEQQARKILGIRGGNASIMSDLARGTVRIAIHQGNTLRGVFFASGRPLKIARNLVTSLIDSDENSLNALAGKAGADRPDVGRIVCACNNVGVNTILAALQDGATSVPALGACTQAGTNCGSCISELQSIIDFHAAKIA